MSTPDAYSMKLRLPDLEPATVSAALSSDGTKIEVTGERKIEHCKCVPSTVREVELPYRPRPEDIDVSIDGEVLQVRLTRHAKTDAPTPLAVKSVAADKDDKAETRPLRFVPHASATEGTLEAQEKSLSDKFRDVARAAIAVASEPPSAKEAAATTAEAAVEANPNGEAATAEKGAVPAAGSS